MQASEHPSAEQSPPALQALLGLLERLEFLPGSAGEPSQSQARDETRRLLAWKVAASLSWGLDGPLICALCGGTNVGKSTIFNMLAGSTRAQVTELARGTKAPFALTAARHESLVVEHLLPGYARHPLRDTAQLSAEADGKELFYGFCDQPLMDGLILLDGPDIDSIRERNLEVAHEMLTCADAIIYVTSEEKYNDGQCVRFLEQAVQSGKSCLAVLNKHENVEALKDFQTTILDPLGDIPCVVVPWQEGGGLGLPGSEELREQLGRLVEARGQVRRAAVRGALERAHTLMSGLFEALRREQRLFAGLRERAVEARQRAGAAFASTLKNAGPEKSAAIFSAVVTLLEIPILDAFFNRVEQIGKGLWRRMHSSKDGQVAPTTRREALELKVAEDLIRQTQQDFADSLDNLDEDFRAAVLALKSTSPITSVDGGGFDAELRAARQVWIDKTLAEISEMQRRTGWLFGMRLLKAAVQLSATGAVVIWTAGIDVLDLLLGPATYWGCKNLLEWGAGELTFSRLSGRYLAARAETFAELVGKRLDALLLDRLPQAGLETIEDWQQTLEQSLTTLRQEVEPVEVG